MGIKKGGFSFIEMVVVMGVIGISLPVLFAIFFGVLNQQIKIQRLSEIKRQGDYVLDVMDTLIRNNTRRIYSESTFTNEKCKASGTTYSSSDGPFYFKDKDNNWLRFYVSGDKVASESSKVTPSVDLTTGNVKVENFAISCTRGNTNTPAIINVSFDVDYNTESTRVEEITTSLHYETKIKLRNL